MALENTWRYGAGFLFERVYVGVPMTLRVSAPGHVDLEHTATPSLGPQTALLLTPSRRLPVRPH